MVKMVRWFDKNNYEQLDYIIFDSYTMELMYHTVYIVRVRDNLKYYRNPVHPDWQLFGINIVYDTTNLALCPL